MHDRKGFTLIELMVLISFSNLTLLYRIRSNWLQQLSGRRPAVAV